MSNSSKKFYPLITSAVFFNCSLPLNLDTYRGCTFQCEYCFMKNRVVGTYKKDNTVPNIQWLKNKFKKVYDSKKIIDTNLIDVMLKKRIDLHCGTKSDPFQPQEKEKQYTKKIVDICNEYDQNIIFTTKGDSYYDVDLDPDKHSFQFSITNHYNDKYLEPNVPSFENRVQFYNQLKDEGFKVGIRFEPFIPNITNVQKCLEYFDEPDVVHIAKLFLLPQTNHDKLIKYIGCSKKDFTTHGTTFMKMDILYENYLKEVFEYLEENGYSYSARIGARGNNDCCCGDNLVHNYNKHDSYSLHRKYGDEWTLENVLEEMGEYKKCNVRSLFTSNRRGNLHTCEDFVRDRWNKPSSNFTPSFYKNMTESEKSTQTSLNSYLE